MRALKKRSKWQGVVTIARLNWPFYGAAVLVFVASLVGFILLPGNPAKLACSIASAGATFFVVGSLAVSHFVYDRSDLYRWAWLDRVLPDGGIRRVVFCHCGFDETSAALRLKLHDAEWQVLDHFDSKRMTEPSIRRARTMFPPWPHTRSCPYDAWPVANESADIVFGLLAIHELRSEAERSAWFAESKRCLREGGCVVLAEHVRDAANFLAFGPGFFHFHSPESWRRSWEHAGLRMVDQFRITPFIRIFVLSGP